MSSVDQRVVQMEFDNAQFEAGIKQSQKTLETFDKSLQSENGQKGLTKMAEAVESVKDKFSALGIAGITVIQNLTNSAVDFAKRLASEFTIEPIKQGLEEYELQMNSVQTIMANTDRNVQDVNASLDDLNVYADKTIYNFAEMTSNIGRFTAAGVGLEDSQAAIKGIANLAALSGSNSQQASMAMYQLSQAIASGRVNLQDWNSVVNAGMGGRKFQEALMRTGEAMGANIDKSKSFRESISGQDTWLTGDILLETLKQISGEYSDAELASKGYTEEQIADIQRMAKNAFESATVVKTFTQLVDTLKEAIGSGWSQSFRTIIGDFEEAKELWTGVSNILSDMIGESADARNAMLDVWKAQGGRDALIEAVTNAWQGLVSILGVVKNAFQEVFPPMTGERLAEISAKIRDGAKAFSEWAQSSEVASTIKDIFTGLFSVIKLGIGVVRSLGQVFSTFILPALKPVAGVLLSVVAAVGRFFTALANGLPSSEAFQQFLDSIKNKLGPVGEVFQKAADKVREFFNSLGSGGGETDFNFVDAIVNKFKSMGDAIKTAISPIAEAIGNFFKPIIDQIKGAIENFPPIDWGDVFATGGLAAITAVIVKFVHDFDKIFGSVDDLINDLKDQFAGDDGIIDKFKGVFDVFQAYQNNLNAQAIRNIAISVGILAASMFVVASIPTEKLLGSVAAMGALFAMMVGAVAALQAIGKRLSAGAASMGAATAAMIGMSVSIAILAGALKSVSDISGEDLLKGVAALASLALIMSYLADTMTQFKDAKNLMSGAMSLLVLAATLKVMASAVEQLAALPFEQLAAGLVGVLALVGMLSLFINTTAKTIGAQGISAGLGILAVSAALLVMSQAVKQLGEMDLASMGQGLLGVAAAMVVLAGGMIAMGKFGAAGLAASTGMLIASAALMVVAQVVKEYASLPIEGVVQGIVALGASLAIMVVGLNLMQGTIAGSAALLIAAAAIAVFTPAILALGSAPTMAVVQGLIALAAAIAIVGVAGALLTPAIPGMLGLGAALALIGASVFLVGAGIAALATGIATLAAVGSAGAAIFVEAMTVVVSGLVALVPRVAAAAAQAIAAFVTTLASSAGEIAQAAVELISQFLTALATIIPQLVDFGLEMLMTLLTGIRDNIKEIVSTTAEIIAEFINGLAEGLPLIIQAGMNFVVSLIEGIADGIKQNAQRVADAMRSLGEAMIEAFCTLLGIQSPSTVFEGFGGNILQGLINGITNAIGSVISTVVNVGTQIITTIANFVAQVPQKGIELVQNLASGIANTVGSAVSAAADVVSNVVSTIGGFVGEFLSQGVSLIQSLGSGIGDAAWSVSSAASSAVEGALSAARGFIDSFASVGNSIASGLADGISAGWAWVTNAASSLAESAYNAAREALDSHSPSRKFIQLGMDSDEGLAIGFRRYVGVVTSAVDSMVDRTVDRANLLSDRLTSAMVGNVVLDFSEIVRRAGDTASLMSAGRSYQLASALSGADIGSGSRSSSYVDSHNRTVNQTNNISFPEGMDNVYEAIDYMITQLNLSVNTEGR